MISASRIPRLSVCSLCGPWRSAGEEHRHNRPTPTKQERKPFPEFSSRALDAFKVHVFCQHSHPCCCPVTQKAEADVLLREHKRQLYPYPPTLGAVIRRRGPIFPENGELKDLRSDLEHLRHPGNHRNRPLAVFPVIGGFRDQANRCLRFGGIACKGLKGCLSCRSWLLLSSCYRSSTLAVFCRRGE